jgi:hypothetical protein
MNLPFGKFIAVLLCYHLKCFYLVEIREKSIFANSKIINLFISELIEGGLAQLARALAWHVRGHRFDPDILHFFQRSAVMRAFFLFVKSAAYFFPTFATHSPVAFTNIPMVSCLPALKL